MGEGTGLIRRFYEDVIGKGQLDLVDTLTTEDIIDHEEGIPGQPPGREGVRVFVNAFREAFPGIRPKAIGPTMADGDLEAAHVVLTGTHNGELMGPLRPARPWNSDRSTSFAWTTARSRSMWGVTDAMTLMRRVGALPE